MTDREVMQQALEALEYTTTLANFLLRNEKDMEPMLKANKAITALKSALEQQKVEPVAFITPLMEQQMFDDWCPYKNNPDPRTVWAAAIEAVNGLLLGAYPPQRKRPTAKQINVAIDTWFENSKNKSHEERMSAALKAAHGIKEQP